MPTETPGKAAGFPLGRGDVLVVETSGGGGYGDPFQREPESVLADVRAGYVTEEGARKDYAVIVRGGAVDEEATRTHRQAARATRRALTLVLKDEKAYGDSRRRCYMSPATLAGRDLEKGDLVELRGKWGVPLRAWTEEDADVPENAVGLDKDGVAILAAEEGDGVFLSPVSV